ncbi:nuclease-related domain-containing protein [Mammaliicoccus sciuri]|uniref:nuclease-related domain-containing protein n=1 Tax=Mammaliicoccus sciuri TaxID=1296 RepID=UPI00065BA259|nr:nuclease-related domain-containing protein [Mammaliicoccus sciuri]PNY95920.1 NERD domain-containing protein [Mammaliicoccus sciuri]WRY62581.1 nuclease-related domain-containing protein [Mammaliicoccus sciuri]SQE51166.1 Nuclease-related domain [Mammaliicoccus sciuri]
MKIRKNLFLAYIDAFQNRVDELPENIDEQYQVTKQGYEGEKAFAQILESYGAEWWLYDLQIKNYNHIQFDFVVITDDAIIQFEIKNYTGDYYFENHKLYRSTGFVSKDLINQYEVAQEGLKRIVEKYKLKRKVESYVVFIHPTFTLHGDLRSRMNIILKSEVHKIKDMVSQNFKYEENKWIYCKLKSLHEAFLNTNQIPNLNIEYKDLKRGVRCTNCRKLIRVDELFNKRKYLKCHHCKRELNRTNIIIQSLEELYLLKGAPFSVKEAEMWTGVYRSSIKRILYKYFIRSGNRKSTRYGPIKKYTGPETRNTDR